MEVKLEKEDLVAMVSSSCPHYDLFFDSRVSPYGRYIGGMNDRWEWDTHKLDKLEKEHLYSLYLLCKHSWKEQPKPGA